MDKKTKGAWLVHHSQKLQNVSGSAPTEFQAIQASGRAAALLSAFAQDTQVTIPKNKVDALASAAGINPIYELPGLLGLLVKKRLVETSESGIDVLGVTSSTILERTSEIFDDTATGNKENASIGFSEIVSNAPAYGEQCAEFIRDEYHIPEAELSELFSISESIGFIDFEDDGYGNKIYFNGNLFRKNETAKAQKILSGLSAGEEMKVVQVNEMLLAAGCLELAVIEKILGDQLFAKLNAIGFYDINLLHNDMENVAFVTRPAAFNKYGDAFIDDALDLAKALVSSLTYGMTKSSHARGKITMIEALLDQLIVGNWIGPVDAIGQDYRALELKGVVSIRHGKKGNRSGPLMRLLKREVGELAKQVIESGDASAQQVLHTLPGATVTSYTGPEKNRAFRRGQQRTSIDSKKATRDILMTLRTGGIV